MSIPQSFAVRTKTGPSSSPMTRTQGYKLVANQRGSNNFAKVNNEHGLLKLTEGVQEFEAAESFTRTTDSGMTVVFDKKSPAFSLSCPSGVKVKCDAEGVTVASDQNGNKLDGLKYEQSASHPDAEVLQMTNSQGEVHKVNLKTLTEEVSDFGTQREARISQKLHPNGEVSCTAAIAVLDDPSKSYLASCSITPDGRNQGSFGESSEFEVSNDSISYQAQDGRRFDFQPAFAYPSVDAKSQPLMLNEAWLVS